MVTVTIDGKTINVENEDKAALIRAAFDSKEDQLKQLDDKMKEMSDEMEELKKKREELQASEDELKTKLQEAEAKSSDEAIQERLEALSSVRDTAVKIAGDKFTCDSLDPMAIKRAALATIRDGINWDDKSDDYVNAAWDMQVDSHKVEPGTRDHRSLGADIHNLDHHRDTSDEGSKAMDSFLYPEEA